MEKSENTGTFGRTRAQQVRLIGSGIDYLAVLTKGADRNELSSQLDQLQAGINAIRANHGLPEAVVIEPHMHVVDFRGCIEDFEASQARQQG